MSARDKAEYRRIDPEAQRKIRKEPALLRSEKRSEYDRLLRKMRSAINCRDAVEEMYVRDIVDETWAIIRFRKAGIEAINQRAAHQKRLDDRAQERARNEEQDKKLKVDTQNAIKNDSTRKDALEMMLEPIEHTISDEEQRVREIHDAVAVENTIDTQIKLDQLIGAAYKRPNDALRQIAWYRKEFAVELKRASDAAIGAAVEDQETGQDIEADRAPLVPDHE